MGVTIGKLISISVSFHYGGTRFELGRADRGELS